MGMVRKSAILGPFMAVFCHFLRGISLRLGFRAIGERLL
jgi:hypothetical protein